MKRCSRCVMPASARGITLDSAGLCDLCREYKPFIVRGEEALRAEVTALQNDGAAHNCVVGLSGGRDSAYTLFYAKKILGLRPIAVHNDNDFETEAARINLVTTTQALNVPLVRIRSRECLSRQIVAAKLTMNAPYGPALVLAQTCEACKYGFEAGAYNTARREGIGLVIWGDSTAESTEPYFKLVEQQPPSRWQRLLSREALSYLQYKYLFFRMQHEYGSDKPNGLHELHLYDYVEWDRRVIVKTIEKELSWKKPEGAATSWRIDCALVPLVNYLTKKAYGVSKLELGFGNMVRAGKMDREEALAELAKVEHATTVTHLEQFAEASGMSRSAIRKILY